MWLKWYFKFIPPKLFCKWSLVKLYRTSIYSDRLTREKQEDRNLLRNRHRQDGRYPQQNRTISDTSGAGWAQVFTALGDCIIKPYKLLIMYSVQHFILRAWIREARMWKSSSMLVNRTAYSTVYRILDNFC